MAAQKWEYKVEMVRPVGDQGREEQLNALAEQGWELVAVDQGYLYFKREK